MVGSSLARSQIETEKNLKMLALHEIHTLKPDWLPTTISATAAIQPTELRDRKRATALSSTGVRRIERMNTYALGFREAFASQTIRLFTPQPAGLVEPFGSSFSGGLDNAPAIRIKRTDIYHSHFVLILKHTLKYIRAHSSPYYC
jgi:hypothetical protein